MKNMDRVISIAFIVIGGIFFINTFQLPEDTQMYPRFLIGLMTFLAVILLIKSFIKEPEQTWKELFGHVELKRFLIVLIASIMYLFLINVLGFFITTISFLLITMTLLKATRNTIVISIPSFVIVLYLIFKVFLKVPLPTGILI